MGSTETGSSEMLAAPPPRPLAPPSPSSSATIHQLPHNQESDDDCSSMDSGSEGGDAGVCHAPTTPGSGQDSRGHSPQQAHTPPEHKHPINGFMSSLPGLQALAAMQQHQQLQQQQQPLSSPVASSPLRTSPMPMAPSPLMAPSSIGNAAPLNLSINSAQPNNHSGANLSNSRLSAAAAGLQAQPSPQQPLVPQSGMPQLILASGQISQGIQGAQLLIPTSQGIMTQTILTIPLSANSNPGVVGAVPPVPNQQMMSSTLANIAHQYNQNNNISPTQGLGLSQLMSNGCGQGSGPLPYQQSQPSLTTSLQQNALQQTAAALQQSALQHTAAAHQNAAALQQQQSALQQTVALQSAAAAQQSALQQSSIQPNAVQQSSLQQNSLQQSSPLSQPSLQQRLESPQLPPPPPQRSPQHSYNPTSLCVKTNGSGSGASSPGSPLNTISRLAANNTDLTITTTSPSMKRPALSPSQLDLMDDPNQPMISESRSNTVDGINLDEIKEFAKAFKLRRLSLGLTQTQVGQALSVTEGPAYSQSAICSALATQMYCAAQLASQQQSMFEKLDITPKSAQKIKPVLEQWMKEAEERYKSGQNHLTEFIGVEPSKKRKRRTSFTPQALELLNAHFERNTHPSGTEITTLAHQLGYEREVIRIWFCNKRQALKNTVRMMSKGCT